MNMNRIALCMAAFLLVLPSAPVAWAEHSSRSASKAEKSPSERGVDVFVAGKGNPYASIRIPCLINAGGILVAMAEGRYTNTDQGQNDLIVSISRDGRKWSKPAVAAASKGATFNNPCLVYDEETKTIWCFFQRYPEGVKERSRDIPTGWEDKRCVRNFVMSSKNGKKWSKPRDVTATTKNDGVTIMCSGPNPGVQLTRGAHKGRLVVPMNEGPFGSWTLAAVYSDDHGKTWRIGEKSAAGGGVNEVSVAETEGGGLFIVSRSSKGGGHRKVARSDDGGGTWGEISSHSELPCVGCQNGMSRYSFADDGKLGGKSRILFSAPTNGRNDGVVKMSYDDGRTWPVSKEVISGPFAYSVLAPVKPGVMGILYEVNSGNVRNIRFTTFTVDWLTDGADRGLGAAGDAPSPGED